MTVSKKDVEHVAVLARLGLTEEEKELFAGQLSKILDHFSELQKLDTKNIEPTSHSLAIENVFRDDVARPFPNPEIIVAQSADHENNFYRVPRILDENA